MSVPFHVINHQRGYEMGLPSHNYRKVVRDLIINYCKNFKLYKMEAPFDRRVTCILWHPTNARLLAVASHGGDILLYSYENDISTICLMKGCGAGGSIQVEHILYLIIFQIL